MSVFIVHSLYPAFDEKLGFASYIRRFEEGVPNQFGRNCVYSEIGIQLSEYNGIQLLSDDCTYIEIDIPTDNIDEPDMVYCYWAEGVENEKDIYVIETTVASVGWEQINGYWAKTKPKNKIVICVTNKKDELLCYMTETFAKYEEFNYSHRWFENVEKLQSTGFYRIRRLKRKMRHDIISVSMCAYKYDWNTKERTYI
jgi:hypothetical protein